MIENIEYEVDGVKDWYKIKDDGAFTDIIDGWKNSDKEAYLRHTKKFNVVVQAGGYCGIFPRLLSQLFSVVYTFEPDPMNFHCLVMNCPIDNVIKIQGALGDKHEMVSIIRNHERNRGMNTVRSTKGSMVPTFRIDDMMLPECDLIQLDTEGYEYKILLGAMNTIETFKPTIIVEDTNSSIEDFLFQYDYRKCDVSHRDTVYAI